jgi:hypothetical protein
MLIPQQNATYNYLTTYKCLPTQRKPRRPYGWCAVRADFATAPDHVASAYTPGTEAPAAEVRPQDFASLARSAIPSMQRELVPLYHCGKVCEAAQLRLSARAEASGLLHAWRHQETLDRPQ